MKTKLIITKQTGPSPLDGIKEAGRVYLALDVHARHCVLGAMREDGSWLGDERLPTDADALKSVVEKIQAGQKWLTFEEGSMALWLCDALRPLVDKLLVCDPRENALIGRSAKKADEWDVRSLCRLLRLGELKEVWHSQDAARREFVLAAEHYIELRKEVVRCKNTVKARFRRSGVNVCDTKAIYSAKGRGKVMAKLPTPARRLSAAAHYTVLDALQSAWDAAWKQLRELGRGFAEVASFEHIPGVGEVGAHLFSALIADPHRFATRQKLWRYCKLGVTSRSSDGKPLGYERLDRHGNGELKAVSYHAWKGALVSKGQNEVKEFFQQSLIRTGDRRHARLNTQRKILEVLWTLWRKGQPYDPQRFAPQSTPPAPGHDLTHAAPCAA